jgi:ubiquinone/menaquinone biosynthesis C-methylase UbiE
MPQGGTASLTGGHRLISDMDIVQKSISIEGIASAYDKKFLQGNFRESDSFYRWVLKTLAPTPGATLLDISCGEGHLLRWAERWGLQCYGLDISYQALNIAKQQAPKACLLRANGEALPFNDESFNYVTNLGSLEHYRDPQRGTQEIQRVLKKEGRAVLVLPNSYYLVDIMWSVWRTGYGPSHHQIIERFATAGEWQDFLHASGLQVLKSYKYNFKFPRSLSDVKWYTANPHKILNLLVSPFIPFNLSYCFLFVCVKASSPI